MRVTLYDRIYRTFGDASATSYAFAADFMSHGITSKLCLNSIAILTRNFEKATKKM